MRRASRNFWWIHLVAAAAVCFVFATEASAARQEVTLCHAPPGNLLNAHEIVVSEKALEAHLRNHPGDQVGICPNAPRFEDCGDGTVADHQTGLQWEKKTGTLGDAVACGLVDCPNPRNVNNQDEWSDTQASEPGVAFTDFLARLNGKFDPAAATGCFVDRCDWRLPEISELQTILIGPDAAPGQAMTCSAAPCIDPDFAAVGGPTAPSPYWSATTNFPFEGEAWTALFNNGLVSATNKETANYVRAVRTGPCH